MSGTTPAPAAPVPLPRRPTVPAALSRFVGRGRELAALTRALDAARLLTVLGPGGAGKTRLVRELAARQETEAPPPSPPADAAPGETRAGFAAVWWVELAAAADVAGAVAAVVGAPSAPGLTVQAALAAALRPVPGGRVLLVLDNCEHVVEAVAELADALLRTVPGLVVLATSREALGVEGEVAWPVPPLACPTPADATGAADAAAPLDPATLGGYEAVQLFVDRARAVVPGFELTAANASAVAQICARLDGLPLALELAAAVLPTLGIEALAARLDDALGLLTRGRRTALPRHRTLRAVLDWSHALLDPAAQTLLARLAVFRAPFGLEAVEAVAAGTGAPLADETAVLGALSRLVAHSLVEVREAGAPSRYRLLEPVRQYGEALLRESGDEHAVRGRHAAWVLRVARALEPDLHGPSRGRTVRRVRREVDEVRAALAWAAQVEGGRPTGAPMTAVRIAGALGWFWISGVPWEEARALLAATLAAADAEGIADAARPPDDALAVAEALFPAAGLAYLAGDVPAIHAVTGRALALWDRVDGAVAAGHPALPTDAARRAARGRSLVQQVHGLGHAMGGAVAAGVAALDRGIAVAHAAGEAWVAALVTSVRAQVHFMGGAHAAAEADYRTAVDAFTALGDRWFLSLAHEGRAANALAAGDVATAAREARRSLASLREEPDAWFTARSLDTLVGVLVAADGAAPGGTEGDAPRALARLAARLLGAGAALRQRVGATVMGTDRERREAAVATLRARLGAASFGAAHVEGEALTLDAVLALVADDRRLAAVADAARPADPDGAAPPGAAPAAGPWAGPAPAPGDHAASSLAIAALGPLEVRRGGVPLAWGALPPGKATALLLLLVLHPEGRTREQVARALWPRLAGPQVGNVFHVTLYQLRRALRLGEGNASWIAFAEERYQLLRALPADGAAGVGAPLALDCDVDAVLAAADALRHAERRRLALAPDALAALGGALARRRGPLGYGLAADWLLEHEDRVRAAWADATEALARRWTALGDPHEALAAIERLLDVEPLRESAHRVRLEALGAAGERARALAAYDALVALLAREVGARPARETQALAAALRR